MEKLCKEGEHAAEDGAADDVGGCAMPGRKDAHQRQGDDAEGDADHVRNTVGPFFTTAAMELFQAHLNPVIVLDAFFVLW